MEMDRIGPKKPVRHYLREWRTAKGLTQTQLAERVGTTPGTISLYENHKRKVSLDLAAIFGDALGIGPLAVFRDPNTPSFDELLAKATPEKRREALAIVQALLKAS